MSEPFVTYFMSQFPDGNTTETADAMYSTEKSDYIRDDLNIGWQLFKYKTKWAGGREKKTVYKTCLRAVFCGESSCEAFSLERRPKSTVELIEMQTCDVCHSLMRRTTCGVRVTFYFENRLKCTMKHTGNHTHKKYAQKHLTKEQRDAMDEHVKENPHTTPKASTVGVDSRSGTSKKPLSVVANILNNLDRTRYELNKARERTGISKNADFLGDLGRIQEEYSESFCCI